MLKNTQQKRKIKKEEIVSLIIAAATPLIHDHTFTQISIQDFCKMAGITTGMFYRHFKTKNDLMAFVYNQETKNILENLPAETPSPSLEEQMLELSLALIQPNLKVGPDGLLMHLQHEEKAVDCEEARRNMEQVIESILQNAARQGEMLPEGKTAKSISDDLAILLKGLTFEWYTKRDSFDYAGTSERMLRRMMPIILYK